MDEVDILFEYFPVSASSGNGNPDPDVILSTQESLSDGIISGWYLSIICVQILIFSKIFFRIFFQKSYLASWEVPLCKIFSIWPP